MQKFDEGKRQEPTRRPERRLTIELAEDGDDGQPGEEATLVHPSADLAAAAEVTATVIHDVDVAESRALRGAATMRRADSVGADAQRIDILTIEEKTPGSRSRISGGNQHEFAAAPKCDDDNAVAEHVAVSAIHQRRDRASSNDRL